MIATNNLGIYSLGQIGTILDMATPKKAGRRRPELEAFDLDSLNKLIDRLEAVRGEVISMRNQLSTHGPESFVKVNYGPAVRTGLNNIAWFANDIEKKISQGKVRQKVDGKVPTDDDELPPEPSRTVPPRRRQK
jgi:hypothetical protein